jgi:hypothetical protein
MKRDFDAADWFWIVDGDETELWSSAAGAYVDASDSAYLAFLASGGAATRVANAFELDQVLRQHGMTVGRSFTAEEALDAVGRIDMPRLKAALGREDVRPGGLVAGDADKLRALAQELQPTARTGVTPAAPLIDGAAKAVTLGERIEELERGMALQPSA